MVRFYDITNARRSKGFSVCAAGFLFHSWRDNLLFHHNFFERNPLDPLGVDQHEQFIYRYKRK